ncbi:MAG: phosphate ABC transporter ATP-binding protein [Desulfurococcales archaeon]|nr:phosphate ABC transporter ATP-binding protein [Desulfurococcales archaeon]
MAGYALEVRGLHVWLRDKHVVKGVSFRCPEATITAIMGPSGTGKSTLLRALNRLIDLNPDARVEGEVLLRGESIYDMEPYELRRRVAMVFQEPNPFPHMSIYDNVAIGPRLHGLARDRRELDKIVRWALEKAMLWDEVKDRLHDSPMKLSGGQRQRLSLARALALKPEVLLLDEPTANVDPVNAVKIEEAIRDLVREEGVTVVFVTHLPSQAVRVSEYLIFMYDGRIVEHGPSREVALNPRNPLTERFFRGEL